MFLYNLVIRAYTFLIYVSAFKHPKAKQWVQGRKQWKKKLQDGLKPLGDAPRIWMHCASYGEFEQGRPLLEALRKKYPDHKLVLSFYSPSGYEAFKNWAEVDLVTYLPFDSAKNAAAFIQLVNPKTALFIKYEFWLNFLFGLKKAAVPTYLVSAVFKPHHPFFKWYGHKFRESLSCYNRIFVQDKDSYRRLLELGAKQALITGDTRFDRVLQVRENFQALPFFEEFSRNAKLIVGGSTWPGDDDLLLDAFKLLNRPDTKLVLVPHEVGHVAIQKLREKIRALQLTEEPYSKVSEHPPLSFPQVLVVDRIGLLSRIYHYADVCYVGGGFNEGLHNCLEPAVHLKPVFFYGESYHKFNEVLELMTIGAAKKVENSGELSRLTEVYLIDPDSLTNIKQALQQYFEGQSGSTQKVLKEITIGLS